MLMYKVVLKRMLIIGVISVLTTVVPVPQLINFDVINNIQINIQV